MLEQLLHLDRNVLIYLNALGAPPWDGFWSQVTEIYTWIPLFVLFAMLLFRAMGSKEAVAQLMLVLLLVALVVALTNWTKGSVARLRPNNTVEINTMIRILKQPTDYSFFSGHASCSFAITVFMFLALRYRLKWAHLFFIWPLLFSFSRIYVGVHYPMDILVGGLVGSLLGFLFHRFHLRYLRPYLGSNRL